MTINRITMRLFLIVLVFHVTHAWVPPTMGLGAIFLKPQGMKTEPSFGDSRTLMDAADFFMDGFWSAKVGGGAKELSDSQRKSLYGNQMMEFQRRYGMKMSSNRDRRSELLICRNGKNEIMGVAGLEVDRIPKDSLKGQTLARAPLMSNLAVGRKFRRRGIAEELVQQAENMARKEWGYDECYLYVEQRNKPAIRLYQKMGYKKLWQDDSAKTLLPTTKGSVENTDTTIVCMRKRLNGGIFGRFFS